MGRKTRIHDGLAGALVTAGVILGYFVNPLGFLLSGVLGVLMLQGAFTGFCPVYFTLNKIVPAD